MAAIASCLVRLGSEADLFQDLLVWASARSWHASGHLRSSAPHGCGDSGFLQQSGVGQRSQCPTGDVSKGDTLELHLHLNFRENKCAPCPEPLSFLLRKNMSPRDQPRNPQESPIFRLPFNALTFAILKNRHAVSTAMGIFAVFSIQQLVIATPPF